MKLIVIFAALSAMVCMASAGAWFGRSGWSSGWSSPVVVRKVVYSSPSYGWSGYGGYGGGYGGGYSGGYGGGYGGYGGYGSGWKSGLSSGWW